MASLKTLKGKMAGIKKTAKVTKAMESISAIKMRSAQKKAIASREYSFRVFSIVKRVSKLFLHDNVDLFFKQKLDNLHPTVILLISPDKGLTGGMNNFLFKKVDEVIKDQEFTKENLSFVCVGKKGYEYVSKKGFEVIKYFDLIAEKSTTEEIKEVSEYMQSLYAENKCARIKVIYTTFINTSEQTPKVRRILPINYKDTKKFIKEILPDKGKFSDIEHNIDIDHSDVGSYLFEPDIKDAVKTLTEYVMHIGVYHSILEAFASEHSARMLAMKNSTDKADELSENIRKKVNKERQAQITKEISEIVSGIESMKK
ncbi:ATP synthase F1 subunit gamma [Candidatus Campbellbacteria bacterium]|nr:MAG: ATP synthase F1 subunit gamma [Candidatus Campbellbacteria bacterium]